MTNSFSSTDIDKWGDTFTAAAREDELLELCSRAKQEIGGKEAAMIVAKRALRISPRVVRWVAKNGTDEAMSTLVANPHFSPLMISWITEFYFQAERGGGVRAREDEVLLTLEIAARRGVLSLSAESLARIYAGSSKLVLVKEWRKTSPDRLTEALDVLYDVHVHSSEKQDQNQVILWHWEEKPWTMEEDKAARAIAGHPYTSSAEVVRMYRTFPNKEMLSEICRSGRFQENDIRELFWERIKGAAGAEPELEWASWLLMYPVKEDFQRAWDLVSRNPDQLESLIQQEHFPEQALAWLDEERLALLMRSENSTIRLKAIRAVGARASEIVVPMESRTNGRSR